MGFLFPMAESETFVLMGASTHTHESEDWWQNLTCKPWKQWDQSHFEVAFGFSKFVGDQRDVSKFCGFCHHFTIFMCLDLLVMVCTECIV